jgi:uncharacterized protein YbjT (DUF2867 family)
MTFASCIVRIKEPAAEAARGEGWTPMSDLIVVTSAAGGVGRPLVERLSAAGEHVRAFVKNDQQAGVARRAGAAEVVVGDLRDASALTDALRGAGRAYHAAPTQIIDEQPLLDAFIDAATSGDLRHLVFHSVVHPDLHVLPHHHQKDVAEQRLKESGIPVTVLRPSHYMQNYLELWDFIRVGSMPYPVSTQSVMGVVDVEDVAEAAVRVLRDPSGHVGQTYDLSAQELTREEMATAWSEVVGHRVTAVRIPPASITNPLRSVHVLPQLVAALPSPRATSVVRLLKALDGARNVRGINTWSRDAVDTYRTMMSHYDEHGLPAGDLSHLPTLLDRAPTSYAQFARREAARRGV